eukprot:gnl/MRDRNA2_/MRDRNA2_63310_c0_seq3.p1 gnl/MRDRNA2_/MRDRNA2_63310_c0~~gnl/MRDRNA2_/MRDRNA2_63310_c0_seq3.p1  ORF type:complete len:448 (+),score=82.92 gnl/MRDRNA2_/MRDRNA2_63310_c0_seq3:221-1564(+)
MLIEEIPPVNETGEVVSWEDEKAFGFIKPYESSEPLFCHVNSLLDGEGSVKPGDRVTYLKKFNDRKEKFEATAVRVAQDDSYVPGEGETGEVISWNEDKAFGFIKSADGSEDLFAHVRSLVDGEGSVKRNDQVTYFKEYNPRSKKYSAVEVRCKAEISGSDKPDKISSFAEANLPEALMANMDRCRWTKPSSVQKWVIPIVLAKRDAITTVQTDKLGQTVAYMFPFIAGLLNSGLSREPKPVIAKGDNPKKAFPLALVLTPNVSHSMQIHAETLNYTYQTGIRSVVVHNEAAEADQLRDLEAGCDILVAMPDRLHDFIDNGAVSVERVRYLTIEEADKCVELEFESSIRSIVKKRNMPIAPERQTLMFAQRYTVEVQQLASDFLHNYLFVTVGRDVRKDLGRNFFKGKSKGLNANEYVGQLIIGKGGVMDGKRSESSGWRMIPLGGR